MDIFSSYGIPIDSFLLIDNLGVGVKFFCKSSLKWNICQWLRPNTVNRPCQSFSSSGSTSCDAVWQRSNNRPEYDDGSSYDIEDRYALIDFILVNRAILLLYSNVGTI